jgi:hypothetical protein
LINSHTFLSRWLHSTLIQNCSVHSCQQEAYLNPNNQSNSHMKVGVSAVPLSDAVELLDVTLDRYLNFYKHCQPSLPRRATTTRRLSLRQTLFPRSNCLIYFLRSFTLCYHSKHANSAQLGDLINDVIKVQRIQNFLTRTALSSNCLLFDGFIGYLFTVELVSSLPPLHSTISSQYLDLH